MSNLSLEEQKKYDQLEAVIEAQKDQQGNMMSIMQSAQDIFGYLPKDVQIFIADKLNVPVTDIYGVATFYTQFALEAKGKYQIGVCMGTACYVRGSQKILDKTEAVLGVKTGQTTKDGLFTLEATRCLGCCGLAPVLMVGDEVFGRLTEDSIDGIIKEFHSREA
ncbi:NAD(P)H-dependent oxidoreductase subunit E [Clostridia bacterium OttesenSCG-928-F22]|nr:NAD(P)H-dependent oxidoreductase subunit E [Clostridia bacterium OttesenSCG-928-F22]